MKFLAPSILSADFTKLADDLNKTIEGGADWIHCDVMDGIFVPNISFGPMIVAAVNRITGLTKDVHLMIKNPDALIPEFAKAGADYITVHQEEVVHLHRTLSLIKSCGAKAGIAINPATPFSTLTDIAEYADLILVMTVNPGFGGQSFISSCLKKIEQAADFREKNNLNYLIEVDGGITSMNIKEVSDAGCDVFVAGSSVFSSGNIIESTKTLKNLI
ncbi:MAG: ribulose-phosphate 3-epimerase [Ignavibacteriaceae bacterium]|nr:ribulose-phosphate 3-epimerase [Ignavibacteriaceae bacterium]